MTFDSCKTITSVETFGSRYIYYCISIVEMSKTTSSSLRWFSFYLGININELGCYYLIKDNGFLQLLKFGFGCRQ